MAATNRARKVAVAEGFVEARTEPSVAFDLATKNLNGRFDELVGISRVDAKGQILWIVENTYALRVKRLDEQYRPSNHDSAQQKAIRGQYRLGGLPPLIYVTVGGRYSAVTGLPEEYVAVKHIQKGRGAPVLEWVVDLAELASGELGPGTPTLPIRPVGGPSPVPVIRARQRRSRDGDVGDQG
jgi:hypothetical protein